MNIAIVGTGYVGLPTGVGFAKLGHSVICVDVDKAKVDRINSGEPVIHEEGLEELLKEVLGKRFSVTTDIQKALRTSDVVFVCVGTPSNEDGSTDLTYIEKVAEDIGSFLKTSDRYTLVVVRSTVPPGTTNRLVKSMEVVSNKNLGKNFGIAMIPEFLREGVAVKDFFNPDRVVIGVNTDKDFETLESLFSDLKAPIFRTNPTTAEMIKYASNSFLAAKVSMINEIGNICKQLGIDVYDVSKGVGMDSRIGEKFLQAGIGFGGSCFPKDVKSLVHTSKSVGYEPKLLEEILQLNERQPLHVIRYAKKHGDLKGKRVTVLGLAFKGGTDDVRESRALILVKEFVRLGSIVNVYDPKAMDNARHILGNSVNYCKSSKDAIEKSELCIIATDWDEFKDHKLYNNVRVIDGRNVVRLDKNYEGVCW